MIKESKDKTIFHKMTYLIAAKRDLSQNDSIICQPTHMNRSDLNTSQTR